MRGYNTIVIATLLMIPFVGLGAAEPVCVDQPPILFCADVPSVPEAPTVPDMSVVQVGQVAFEEDGFTASAVDATAFASAGSIRIEAPYSIVHAGLPGGSKYVFIELSVLQVQGGDIYHLGSEYVQVYTGQPTDVSDTLSVTLHPQDVAADDVFVELRMRAEENGPFGFRSLGSLSLHADVTFASIPPPEQIVTADVRPVSTFEAGTFSISPAGATVDAVAGATIVSPGPLRFRAMGTFESFVGSGYYQAAQDAYVQLYAFTDTAQFGTSRQLYYEYCYNGACAFNEMAGSATIELLVPGDILDPRDVVTTYLRVGSHASANYSQLASIDEATSAQNVVYSA
jgi:hypothetical protein